MSRVKTGKVEGTIAREVDYRKGQSEKLVITFADVASDVSITLGQFFANEAKRGERATFTAFDSDGAIIATGVLAAGQGVEVGENFWRFDLGLEWVARIEIAAADMYEGGKQKSNQSDFGLHAVSYAPTVETSATPSRPRSSGRPRRTSSTARRRSRGSPWRPTAWTSSPAFSATTSCPALAATIRSTGASATTSSRAATATTC